MKMTCRGLFAGLFGSLFKKRTQKPQKQWNKTYTTIFIGTKDAIFGQLDNLPENKVECIVYESLKEK